ncbi:hypothetical protein CMT52_07920 [Elizabethkingia anophelis]|nr:hypothetical protein [Elizabethkingia anophelis]
MNILNILKIIQQAKTILKDRNTYYVIVLGMAAFWLWKDEQKITSLEAKIITNDSIHDKEVVELRKRDCKEEIRAYMELYKELRAETSAQATQAEKAFQAEKKRTEELEKTYQLLNKSK